MMVFVSCMLHYSCRVSAYCATLYMIDRMPLVSMVVEAGEGLLSFFIACTSLLAFFPQVHMSDINTTGLATYNFFLRLSTLRSLFARLHDCVSFLVHALLCGTDTSETRIYVSSVSLQVIWRVYVMSLCSSPISLSLQLRMFRI
jgi:hypothetical protein